MTVLRGNRFGLLNTPEEILSLLENTAGVYGLCSPDQQKYYIWDWTTIRRINWTSLGAIKNYLGAWRRYGAPEIYPSSCGADYLRVKNHYLAFYPRQGSIIKAFLDEDSYTRHLKGVQRFGEFGFCHIAAPTLQGFDIKPSPHTLESYKFGKNYQMIPLDLEVELIKELAEFHFKRPKEIDVIIEENDKLQILENLKTQHPDRILFDKIQSFLERTSWRVIEGEVHGDLNRGNLIRGEEKVYLTDWEFFGRGPVSQDMVKIYFQAGDEIRQHLIKIYQNKQDTISKENHIADFRSSLTLYSIKTYLNLYQQPSDQFVKVTEDPSAVNKKTALLEKNLLDSIQSLLVDHEKQ